MINIENLLEKRIARDANFLRISGLGCLLITLPMLSVNRTDNGWPIDALTVISGGIAIAGCVALLSGALVARTLRKFGSYHTPDLSLNRHEGDK